MKITVSWHTGPMTNEVYIDEFESFKVLWRGNNRPNFPSIFYVEKSGKKINIDDCCVAVGVNIELAGPLFVKLETPMQESTFIYQGAQWLTIEISPQTYDVNKSITLAPGSGAAITLESSTNLVNWSSATNGIYTNVPPPAMFFRIKTERLPQ